MTKRRKTAKPVRIHLGEDIHDPDAMIVKLGTILRAIHALQAEADWLLDQVRKGLVAEGTLTLKDNAKIARLVAAGKHQAAAKYFRSRLAAHH